MSAGLIEMPPVSNVMPLPTSPSIGPPVTPGGVCESRAAAPARRAGTSPSSPMPERLDRALVEDLTSRTRRRRGRAALDEDPRRQTLPGSLATTAPVGRLAEDAPCAVTAATRSGAGVSRRESAPRPEPASYPVRRSCRCRDSLPSRGRPRRGPAALPAARRRPGRDRPAGLSGRWRTVRPATMPSRRHRSGVTTQAGRGP